MCAGLNAIKGLTPEEILSAYNKNGVPVDIEGVIKSLNIKILSRDFKDIEEENKKLIDEKGEILGAVVFNGDDVIIYYSNDSTENRIRFTLAHELAHCCLNADSLKNGHIEPRHDEESDDFDEYAANVFAGKLLIPKDKLNELYNSMIAPLSDVLAKEFGVSVKVMEARLEYLGMPYYSHIATE